MQKKNKLIKGKPAWKYWADKRAESAKKKPLKRTPIKKKKVFGSTVFKPKKKDKALWNWYETIMAAEDAQCLECKLQGTGGFIGKHNKIAWHGSIAHVLPKAIFPSVKTHPDNYVILSMYNCCHHGQYDASWDKAMKMNVWAIVKPKLRILIPLLPQREYGKLPDVIRDLYENNEL